jgi:hypothetical protein
MHYVTRRSYRIPKHKFGVTCLGLLCKKTAPSPPEHEKECIYILHRGYNGMHYVTRRSHPMQKHKFSVTCPAALLVESLPVPHEHDK